MVQAGSSARVEEDGGVEELVRVPCSLSLSDVSLLSEDPCVVASRLFCIYISFSE